jgi:CHAT domain-containing protein/tetratricopeptide (TPR) repeat protein
MSADVSRAPFRTVLYAVLIFTLSLFNNVTARFITPSTAATDLAEYYRLLVALAADSSADSILPLQTFISSHPSCERAYFKLLEFFQIRNDLTGAHDYFAQLIDNLLSRRNSLWVSAKVYELQGDLPRAFSAYLEAAHAGPMPPTLLNDLIEFDRKTRNQFHLISAIRSDIHDRERERLMDGFLLKADGRVAEALSYFNTLSRDYLADLLVLYTYGHCHYLQGNSHQADSLWQIGLDISRSRHDLEYQAKFLNCVAFIAHRSGNLDFAECLYDSALSIALSIDDSRRLLITAGNFGGIKTLRGRHDLAIGLLQEAINRVDPRICQDELADDYLMLGYSLSRVGRLSEAIRAFSDGEKLISRNPDYERIFEFKLQIGQLYSRIRQNALAKKNLQQAGDIAKRHKMADKEILAQASIAYLEILDGNYAEARKLFRQLLQSPQARYDVSDRAYWTRKLGDVDRDQGLYEAAKEKYLKAYQLVKNGKAPIFELSYLEGIGDLELEFEKIDQAIQVHQKVLEMAIVLGDTHRISESHRDLGNDYYKKGELSRAKTEYRQALSFTEKVSLSLQAEALRIGYNETNSKVYKNLAACYFYQYRLCPNRTNFDSLFYWVEMSKGRVLKDIRFGAGSDRNNSLDPTSDRESQQIPWRLRTTQRRLRWQAGVSRTPAQWEQLLADLEAEKYSLIERRLQESNLKTARAINAQPFTRSVALIQKELRNLGYGLLLYSISNDVSFVLVVSGDSVCVVPLSVDAGILAARIDSLMTPFHNVDENSIERTEFRADLAYWLYQVLIKPVEESAPLPSRLLIVPDLILANLPFEMLLLRAPEALTYKPINEPVYADDFLLHKYAFAYSPTVALLKVDENIAPRRKGIAVFANPFEGNEPAADKEVLLRFRTGWRFDPLPFAELEAERLKKDHSAVRIFKRQNATKAAFMKEVPQESIVHIATHAFVDTTFDAFSGLILAAGHDSSDDGILMGYEISSLNLHNDLIVLSACETGRGKLVNGEGVLGLPRQFLAAGASTVMMTLWKVDDRFTSDLMPDFYRYYLGKKQSKVDALKHSKLQILKRAARQNGVYYQHPFYWASFVLFGDPGSEGRSSRKPFTFIFMISMIALAVGIFYSIRRRRHTPQSISN